MATTRPPIDPRRSRFLRGVLAAGAVLAMPSALRAQAIAPMQTRPIASTREPLPVVGCGTWIGFDVADAAPAFDALREVVRVLLAHGGSVLDSSPMYGRSESVAGRLMAEQPGRAFVATKVRIEGRDAGIRQMEQSMALLGKVDLMQVHNLLDWKTRLPTLRAWKAEGRIRHVGVSHYTASAYRELEAVLRDEPLDFVRVNDAIDDREAGQRVLPLAAERGVAVLVNRPFGGGLLRRLAGQPLPPWAAGIGATTGSQVLLKFVLPHPAVTCAIPGTGNPRHMAENAEAGSGAIPDPAFWARRLGDVLG